MPFVSRTLPQRTIAALLALGAAGCARAARSHEGASAPPAPVLRVHPETALVDVPVAVTAAGLAPGALVTITARTPVGVAGTLASSATFRADARGVVDARAQAPLSGSYEGVDAMGLFWAMALDTTPDTSGASPWRPPAPYTVTLELAAEGRVVARARATRRFVAPDVRVVEVRDSGLVGRLYLPSGGGRPPVVLVLTGSEGGVNDADAALLASHGFAALALAYFRAPGLPEELFLIPLEYLKRGMDWVRARPDVSDARVAVLGGSKGAELALLLATTFPDDVAAMVGYAPTSVVWPGISRTGSSRPTSSWSLRGEPVPFLPHIATPEFTDQFRRPAPVRLRVLGETSLRDSAAAERVAIRVERSRAAVLLVSGGDDQMGPSASQAERVMRRLREHGHPYPFAHLTYPDAGHVIGLPFTPTPPRVAGGRLAMGGTAAGYARADADSWPRVLRFLRATMEPATRHQ